MKITLEKNGFTLELPGGYSWTTLLFGCFVPLFRGDMYYAFIMFILACCTCGLSWLFVPFYYNKWHVKRMINKGWVVKN